jgi:hypothetical protein
MTKLFLKSEKTKDDFKAVLDWKNSHIYKLIELVRQNLKIDK